MEVEKQTEMVLAWELFEQGLSKSAIARQLGRNRETIIAWISGIEAHGLKGFLDASLGACKKPRPKAQVDALVKRWVWAIREREEGCCGQKIAYFLLREHGVKLSVPKIYEILSEKYQLRPKRRRNQARGVVPHALAAREVVQMDTVDFGHVFAFTAVDIWSREVDVLLRPSLNSQDGVLFLRFCMKRRFGHVALLQCDGGSEWKGEFPHRAKLFCESSSATASASPARTRRTSSPSSRASTAP
jgi:transposase